MTATDKAIAFARAEDTRIINAVLDGIVVYKRPDTDLYRVMVREWKGNGPAQWTELFWNSETGQHWLGEFPNNSKSIGDEVYVTWLSAPYALRKLALDLRLAALP
jgi:hypothetical protein